MNWYDRSKPRLFGWLCLMCCMGHGWVGLAQETGAEAKAVAPVNEAVAKQLFNDGFKLFKGYKSGSPDLSPLDESIDMLKKSAGMFWIKSKGQEAEAHKDKWVGFNAESKDQKQWVLIVKAHEAEIVTAHKEVFLKKVKKKKEKEIGQFTALELKPSERREALSHLAKSVDWVSSMEPNAAKMLSVVSKTRDAADQKMNPDIWKMGFLVIGGLGIFLIGMKNMSEGVQAIAGNRLRTWIGRVTDNRLSAVGAGTAVTCFVQSSSITTVLVVGFVNSGLMALHQAVGVVMGANIGTTITGWILVLKIGKYGLPILGISALVYLFSKTDRWRFTAMTVFGLGMVFFGLETMKAGFKPMEGVPQFEEFFSYFSADTYFGVLGCALIGCVLTFIVQSSSATLGITIGLASTGVIPFETAAALVLGENIGTTITAWLASIGTTTNAKRAAYAHVLFNMTGVAWVTAIFAFYITGVAHVIEMLGGTSPLGLSYADSADKLSYAVTVTAAIAATHTGFNVINTLMFLPFIYKFTAMLERVIPDKGVKEIPHLTKLDVRMVESSVIGLEQSRGEILKMGENVQKMIEWTGQLVKQDEPDEDLIKKVLHREQIMDNVQHEVVQFLNDLQTGNVPHSVTEEAMQQYRIADEYESISDYISALLKSYLRLANEGQPLHEDERQKAMTLHDQVADYMKLVTNAVENRHAEVLSKATAQGESITHHFKELREAHLRRIAEQKVEPAYSMSYNAILRSYRKIKDHALNIAEAQAGEK